MKRQNRIELCLQEALRPDRLQVINESDHHSRPPGRETHFQVFAISGFFEGKSRVERHRWVQELLAREFDSGLHALTMRLLTPEEWSRNPGQEFQSPVCSTKKSSV